MNYIKYGNWHIYENINNNFPFTFFSDDYDGESVLDETKQGQAATLAEAKQKIDEMEQSK